MANDVLTPKFRVSYPNVFRPRKNELNGKEEYSVVALFPKGTDLTVLKKAVNDALESKFGKEKAKWPKKLKLPFKDQGAKKKTNAEGKEVLPSGYEDGAIYLDLKNTRRPTVVDQKVQDIIDEKTFYPGCWARATVNIFAYDTAGNKGASISFSGIQKVAEGEPLGGGSNPLDMFAPVETDNSTEDLFND